MIEVSVLPSVLVILNLMSLIWTFSFNEIMVFCLNLLLELGNAILGDLESITRDFNLDIRVLTI